MRINTVKPQHWRVLVLYADSKHHSRADNCMRRWPQMTLHAFHFNSSQRSACFSDSLIYIILVNRQRERRLFLNLTVLISHRGKINLLHLMLSSSARERDCCSTLPQWRKDWNILLSIWSESRRRKSCRDATVRKLTYPPIHHLLTVSILPITYCI